MLEHTGYLALATTTPDGVEAGDLVHAVDRVRQVMESGASLAEAAQALETDAETAGDIESLPLEPGRSAVVRVMNLHKAKGLEAKVVFLADPCGDRWRHVSKRVERHADGARGWFSIEKDGEGYGNKVIAQPAGWDEKVEEELRLPRCRGNAPSLRRRHSRPRAARRGALGEAGQRASLGDVRTSSSPVCLSCRCRRQRCRAGRSTAEDFSSVARRRECPARVRARPCARSHVVGDVGHRRGAAHREDGAPD